MPNPHRVGQGGCAGKRRLAPTLWGFKSGGVPDLKGKFKPLSSWPDGKIRCTELLKTRLKAHAHQGSVLTWQC